MKKYKIENLCTVRSSKRIFANQYTNDGIPFYRGKEITLLSLGQKISDLLYINDKAYDDIKINGVPKENDILITAVGTIGSVWLIDHNAPFYFKDGNIIWLSFINADIVLPKYLKYLLTSSAFQRKIEEISIGSNQKALTIDALKKQEIEVPILNIQQHIVDILGSIDNSIENNEFLIKKTNDFLADLFLKYSAKATDYKRLDEICSIITKGTTPTTLKRSFVDYGVPFVKVESLTDSHQIDTNKLAFIDTETHEMLQRSKLKYKDLLISIAGTIGRFALVPKTMPQANTNQAVALVRGSIVSQEYLYALFLSGLCDEQIKAKTVQAVQANLSLSVIGSLSVPYILDNTFNKQINSLYEYIENLAEKNNKLYELKQLYLHKFFG